jgi:hypothetical protein
LGSVEGFPYVVHDLGRLGAELSGREAEHDDLVLVSSAVEDVHRVRVARR